MYRIVGSTAANYQTGGFLNRIFSSDLDVWGNEDSFDKTISSHRVVDYCKIPVEIIRAFEGKEYASINDLYTIKISHLPYDIFWWKHVRDALVLKMKYGAIINEKLYILLQDFWKVEHGNKDFLNLYRTKDKFFDDAVVKEYDHDHLHELIAYPDLPVYTRVLKDGQQVLVDKTKFDSLEFNDRVKMFREEMCVIACERWLLNPKVCGRIALSQVWRMSVCKTTTALTKGWASRFICENLEHFVKHNPNEMKHLFITLKGKMYGAN